MHWTLACNGAGPSVRDAVSSSHVQRTGSMSRCPNPLLAPYALPSGTRSKPYPNLMQAVGQVRDVVVLDFGGAGTVIRAVTATCDLDLGPGEV